MNTYFPYNLEELRVPQQGMRKTCFLKKNNHQFFVVF